MPEFISSKDFRFLELAGTTHGTADTSLKFRHGKGQIPWAWFVLEGDVYVPKNGVSTQELDVRSRLTSQPFRLLVLFEG